MDLSIIIVSWNVENLLRKNLKAIFKNSSNISFEIFVVDNASKDGTAEMIKTEFPQVKLIVNERNFGFAKANNEAIRYASGRYVLLLNPDMRVLPDTLENMVSWMDNHQEAGIAGCRLIKENGKTIPHVRKFPTLFDQLAVVLKLPYIFPTILNKYLMNDFDYLKEAEVDSIRGSFFTIRNEVIEKIGELDERFFIWFEEVDYCKRARAAGFKIFYTPAAKCVDYVGKSFSQVPRGKTQKYFRDSMLKYFKKWHSGLSYWILKIAWPFGILLAMIFGGLKNDKTDLKLVKKYG